MPALDVTDATFESDVLAASDEAPVVVDLWAPWCGPCRTLGPIIEKVVEETNGAVRLAKVNVDENPQVSAAFQVQSIPAVFALSKRKVIDGFIGALPEQQVRDFVARVGGAAAPSEADELVAKGDEASLRQALELEPDHGGAIVALAELLLEDERPEEALALVGRIPENAETRRIAALARLAASEKDAAGADIEARLDGLLERVKEDEDARREYLDLLETLPAEDPRRLSYRRALSSRIF